MALEGKIATALRTDKGRVRDHNEDSVREDPDLGLIVLADGMGGHNAGEVASAMAVHTILESITVGWALRAEMKAGSDGPEAALVRKAVEIAHETIRNQSESQPQYQGMGTTVVVCLLYDNQLIVAHVGDSRLYRLRHKKLEQMTQDHSLLEDLVAKGFYSRDEAAQNVKRNILTRALGSGEEVIVDVLLEPAETGDLYLLCSDGLTEMLPDDQIRLTLLEFSDRLNAAADTLVRLANENGGKDNVSVALARIDRSFSQTGLYQKLRAWI